MYTIGIFTQDKGWTTWTVNGCEAAYNAFHKACEFALAVGAYNAAIWDTITTEILEDLNDWEEITSKYFTTPIDNY